MAGEHSHQVVSLQVFVDGLAHLLEEPVEPFPRFGTIGTVDERVYAVADAGGDVTYVVGPACPVAFVAAAFNESGSDFFVERQAHLGKILDCCDRVIRMTG